MGCAPINVTHVEDAGGTAAAAAEIMVEGAAGDNRLVVVVVVLDNKGDDMAGVGLVLFLGMDMDTEFVEGSRDPPFLRWGKALAEE